tara:strand:+ start:308 stop:715 length:408 start_codon:yes stop_codon:yes gene_type:complete
MSKIIKCSDLKLQIYIEDTDFQGVVYHSNYLKYFERARSEFLSTNNVSHSELKKLNLVFVVKKINLEYIAAAELGDHFIVKSSVEKSSNARMIFYQKLVDLNNEEYVKGTIDICLINLVTKKPQRFPDDLLLIFK